MRLKITLLLSYVCLSFLSDAQINSSNIEIIRDKYGVPHVYALTDSEASYGLAWAHSEDNFETIQKTFLPAVNKLGLHLGKDGATMDFLVQWLKCREVAEKHYKDLSDEVLEVIQGYVEGINAFAKKHPEQVLVKGSFPMNVLDYLTGYNLVIHFFSDTGETLRALMKDKIKPLADTTGKEAAKKNIGSNAIVFSKKITEDKKTYFTSNTHQPLEGPFSWYEAHLNSEEGWNMLGALFPGSPFPMIGTNEHLGWTHTFNYPDLVDIYQLEMRSKNKLQYRVDSTWLALEKRSIKLHVKWMGLHIPIRKKAYWSIFGPVVKNKSGYFAFKSNALENISSIDQWYRMNKASNFDEFYSALELCGLPRFNVVYADQEDNLFYLSTGKIPRREQSYDWLDVLPGNTKNTLTTSYYDIEELPQLLNPKHGYLFNTNNSPYNCAHAEDNLDENDFAKNFGFRERENNRSLRFMELMAEDTIFSYKDFKKIKYDIQYPKKIWSPVEVTGVFKLKSENYPEFSALIDIIQDWDKRSDTMNLGAAQWSIYYKNLVKIAKQQKEKGLSTVSQDLVLQSLDKTQKHLLKYFGKVDILLKDYQLHVRGNKEMAVSGMTDMIVALNTEEYKNGKVKGTHGDSYIMFAKYDGNKVEIETVLPYGQSSHPNSSHFTDQMRMYVQQRRKTMSLDRDEVLKSAVSRYHPN